MPRKKKVPKRGKRYPKRGYGPRDTTKQTATLAKVRQVTITLNTSHNINGNHYGPGEVKVRGDLAQFLMEQERNAKDHDRTFYDKRAFIILGRGRKRQVPYDTFDIAYRDAMPVGTVDGGNYSYQQFGG